MSDYDAATLLTQTTSHDGDSAFINYLEGEISCLALRVGTAARITSFALLVACELQSQQTCSIASRCESYGRTALGSDMRVVVGGGAVEMAGIDLTDDGLVLFASLLLP